ncbi:PDZ domain-containing protein [Lentilactobacillus parabuchneri]|uniref:PDZ domain-containing protein n=1 Tax=Lentilactobacillus parabuchneri TaxID=152331 RepID=UPI0023071BC3|nr:PDZ domain-containing protein [Lentilactobacillus parabuchneri]MDB1103544.1 PDZ domain-containing protein [Lentilactobacillus parabuchneri]
MKILIALGFYVIQPALWIGVIRSYLIYRNRLKKERAIFNSAIYEDFYEGRHFVRSLIIFGVLGSIILGGFLSISLPWLIVYEALMTLFLLVIPWWLLPVTIAGIASVVTLLLPTLPQLAPIFKRFNQLGIRSSSVNPINLLIIFVVVIGLTAVFIHLNGGKFDSPTLVRNQRNNKIAIYKFNELSIFPFLLFVPGDWFHTSFPFMPLFQIGDHAYAVLLVPILLGLKFSVRHSVPRELFLKMSKSMYLLVGVGVVLAVVSYFVPTAVLPSIIVLWLGYYLTLMLAKRRDHQQSFEYSEVMNGIRVIGIQPETPAAKMDLKVGDVILEVNGIKVANDDEFYRALSTNSTYCRFKVLDRNDQLKMTESAIFKNSPHEIGVKTYTQLSN